jgi:hypothetical protein
MALASDGSTTEDHTVGDSRAHIMVESKTVFGDIKYCFELHSSKQLECIFKKFVVFLFLKMPIFRLFLRRKLK